MQEVEIGEGVTSISRYTFVPFRNSSEDMEDFTTITILNSDNMVELDGSMLAMRSNNPANVDLYVPVLLESNYRNHSYWRQFSISYRYNVY